MAEIIKIERVAQFNRERAQKTLHPLVSVLDQSLSGQVQAARYLSGLYIIFLKDTKCEELKYGRNQYDYEEGTLLFIAPGQVFGFEHSGKMLQPSG
jgi:AraC family transcriptional activator of pobA